MHFGHAVIGQRTCVVGFECLFVLLNGFAEFAQLRILFAAPDGNRDAHLVAIAQYAIIGIDVHALGLAEGIHGEFRGGTDHFHALLLGIAFGLDFEVHGHAEGVQVLGDFSHHAKALGGAQNGVFQFELGGSAGFNPLDEEKAKVLSGGGLGDLAKIVGIGAFPGVLLGIGLESLEEVFVTDYVAQHADDGGTLAGG